MNQQELTQMLGEEMYSLLLNYPPKTLNRILRDMFMDYLCHNIKIGEPENFEEALCAMQALFDLLDKAEDKMEVNNLPG